MIGQATAFSYGFAAVLFFIAIAFLAAGKAQQRFRTVLLAALALSFVWALSAATGAFGTGLVPITDSLEQARTIAWFGLLAMLLIRFGSLKDRPILVSGLVVALLGSIASVAIDISALIRDEVTVAGWTRAGSIIRVVVSVAGLLFAENLFRNADTSARWAIKHLCFGLGMTFTYDFFLYAEATLFARVDPSLFAGRGIVCGLAVPLIVVSAARSRAWPVNIHISRRIVFHTATLLAAGFYLLIMSAVGYSLKEIDQSWGRILQISFLAAAIIVLFVIFSSESVRARLRRFINENFFSYKYDYREEWLRFIDAFSSTGEQTGTANRALSALANLVESPGGALWLFSDEDFAYRPAAVANFGEGLPSLAADDSFIVSLRREARAIEFTEETAIPPWLDRSRYRPWLALPLYHRDELVAFLVLAVRRTAAPMDWEDRQLLATAGRQAASYLAEEMTFDKLRDAQRFEDFNRRFAFVVHDIKNVVSQMSLVLRNADKFGDDPEFQKDLLAAVNGSVDRLRTLLAQLRQGGQPQAPEKEEPLDLVALMNEIGQRWTTRCPGLTAVLPDTEVPVVLRRQWLSDVIDHLMQNAIEASGDKAVIAIRVALDGNAAMIAIADNGPGMTPAFIEETLFKPLRSTKEDGFGLGAYQTRDLVRRLGGRLDVQSLEGRGTTFTIVLPLAGAEDVSLRSAHG